MLFNNLTKEMKGSGMKYVLFYSLPKGCKKAACSFEQAALLVRPMRFEGTAFGVGGVCRHRFPADYCFESTVYDRFSA